jgi:hypothetical protein
MRRGKLSEGPQGSAGRLNRVNQASIGARREMIGVTELSQAFATV